MKIFVYNLREYDEKAYFDEFCHTYGCTYAATAAAPTLENASLATGYDAINILTTKMDEPLLARFDALGVRFVATRTIGYDHIDVAAAHRMGMRVMRISYSPSSVANYTIMLMLMACRNIVQILERARLQDFSLRGKIGRELSQCTVGVIGTGAIGATVIRHLSGFGCRLLAYDPAPDAAEGLAKRVPLEGLLAESDIITLHVPALESTYHMIDDAAIGHMKDGVILVNTARGTLVDTAALIRGLNSGKIGFAALDVLEHERELMYRNRMNQVIGNHDLAVLNSYPNVIVSPHTAFYTQEAVSNMVENSIRGLMAFEAGQENPFEV
ncbi:MAG: D-isomer specific 2-hydroxyacid dehydrogenase family protein [Candidatus Limiplasma sp.]|nr:D-isomer specific 2-hydroxyacid dehydrogenase family protein [Candidatus Limiplasma sp.]MEA5145393.1 D-isomer specific 2-hydroxyacid dehydrogenase family protein [Candidatus Limiplasma sp.]